MCPSAIKEEIVCALTRQICRISATARPMIRSLSGPKSAFTSGASARGQLQRADVALSLGQGSRGSGKRLQ